MHSYRLIKNIKKYFFGIATILAVSFGFSAANIYFSSSYSYSHEILANSISYCHKKNGYVHFELEKHYGNYINTERYHINQFAQIIGYQNVLVTENVPSGFSYNDSVLDYNIDSLGSFVEMDNYNLPDGFSYLWKDSDFKKESNIEADLFLNKKPCLISREFALLLLGNNGEDFSQLSKKEFSNSRGIVFSIVAVVDQNCMATKQSLVGDVFFCSFFQHLITNDNNHSLHFYLSNQYSTNSSAFLLALTTFLNERTHFYLTLKMDEKNQWYINEIQTIINRKLDTPVFFIFCSSIISIVIGLSFALLNNKRGNRFSNKESFFLFIFLILLYFGITIVFQQIFNGLFVNSIHINTMSSVSVLLQTSVLLCAICSFFAMRKVSKTKIIDLSSDYCEIEI